MQSQSRLIANPFHLEIQTAGECSFRDYFASGIILLICKLHVTERLCSGLCNTLEVSKTSWARIARDWIPFKLTVYPKLGMKEGEGNLEEYG